MGNPSTRRIHFLDELRGFCIILMVFYHSFYTVGYLFGVPFAVTLFTFFEPAVPFFAGIFIVISGICCNLSHNNLKRGLCLAAVAMALSAALYLAIRWGLLTPDSQIWFGILQLLATCMLLYTLLYPTIRFTPAWLGFLLCAFLFVLFYHVFPADGGYIGISPLFSWKLPTLSPENPLFYALGLAPVDSAGDYFPLLPWSFCFFGGCFIGRWRNHFPRWMFRRHVPLFAGIGKASLWIYLAHQPVIYAVCLGVQWIVNSLS